jgi:GNAT superfamily N-acetyltransferase
MDYHIVKAELSDAEEILKLQKLAYRIEAELYDNYEIAPLKQTVDELEMQFRDHIILKAVSDDRIIGTVRAIEGDETCYVGRLAVRPDLQNRGIGTALMIEIEKLCHPKRYELFVGVKSYNNIHLYEKLGYNIYLKDQYGCGNIEIFYMEKINRST